MWKHQINKDFINFIINKNLKLIIGKLISKIGLLKDKKIKYLVNPKDLFKFIVQTSFCKFGVSTYELISIENSYNL